MTRANGHPDDCGCCEGLTQRTPLLASNLPAQPSITYRIGDHARFKASLLAGLSDADAPALTALGTRDEDDFTIAFLDSVATTLDVLTFYQERYANETYLRTAGERLSILEMARLIGYELAPGVAASTHLAFAFQATPGLPPSPDPVIVPIGTKVQSLPDPGDLPRTFETVEPLQARATWGNLRPQLTEAWHPEKGDRDLYLAGVDTRIEAGDVILIVGKDRDDDPDSERWDLRALSKVEADQERDLTRLCWDNPLGHNTPTIFPAEDAVEVFVFRLRASLYGHNAPDPRLLSGEGNSLNLLVDNLGNANAQWKNYQIGSVIDLDSTYPKIQAKSWVVLLSNESGMGTPALPGYAELYRAKRVEQRSLRKFAISGKATRITPDTQENLYRFDLDRTQVLAESVALPVARRPLPYPLYGDRLAMEGHVADLVPGQRFALSGKAQRIKVAAGVKGLTLDYDEGGTALAEGDSLILEAAPERLLGSSAIKLTPALFAVYLKSGWATLKLALRDRDGISGTLIAKADEVELAPPWEEDPVLSEVAAIDEEADAITKARDRSLLKLEAGLQHVYARDSVVITFNVAAATDGESVEEILGSGDARQSDQVFPLKQGPLTFVSADTPSGRRSSVKLRVNDLLWDEVPLLYGQPPDARNYRLRNDDGGTSAAVFGDGIEGGRLPSGLNNVRASYRKGLGAAGNLPTGKISTLVTRPLGIEAASNPEPASGGQDPEVLEDARENAPLTVLTLDRAVSVSDYRDFARTFAGIAKAHAIWVPAGPARGIFLSVAGVDGAAIPPSSKTHESLTEALRNYGDPLIGLTIQDYRPASFKLAMAIKIDAAFESDPVLAAVEAAMREAFSFAKRDFGQNVSYDEVIAVAQAVAGVIAVKVTAFYKVKPAASATIETILQAELPSVSLTAPPLPAELLTLSPEPLTLEVLA